ncbi:MAG: dehydratase [Ruminococcaceae bacterium]|jgi:acyl dehydratase|nr:dehydratase [Oscillospiraceae bacterium]
MRFADMKEIKHDLYFSDITEETEIVTASRTITESDIMLFAGITGDMNELHTSATYAEQTQYGERIAHGLLILSIAGGLYMRTGYFGRSVIANLGIQDWTFNRPVRIGDTIHVQLRLKEKNWIKLQNKGVVVFKVKVINQQAETVASGLWKKILCERPAAK